MDDPEVEDLILDAWETVRPKLERDPRELARRLRRMHSASFLRPPRAWCLCIRAGDRRIDRWFGFDYPTRDGAGAHDVFLEAELLRHLTGPVMVESGVSVREAAESLGRAAGELRPLRCKGTLGVHHVAGLGGSWGSPVPLLSATLEFDPNRKGFELPDRAWGCTAIWSPRCVREDFEQVIRRVPAYIDRNRAYRDKSDLHPEHPDVDAGGVADVRKPFRYRLPPPEPDFVWYKWKGDQFIGYDWRRAETNPLVRENYERYERRKALNRASLKRRRREGRLAPSLRYRSPYGDGGSLRFHGWRWLCPACGKVCKAVYLPLLYHNVLDGLMGAVIEAALHETPSPPPPVKRLAGGFGGYACQDCYRVRNFSRGNAAFWGEVVGYLSGGLLYGFEVPRPPWLTRDRKRSYAPRPSARPAWRRAAVMELLLQGKTRRDIAQHLQMSPRTVDCHIERIYRQYAVHGRDELRRKLEPREPIFPLTGPAAARQKRLSYEREVAR